VPVPLSANIGRIYEQIEAVCAACGRSPAEIRLMAVSKFQPLEAVKEAYAAGARLFGESRVQEAETKLENRAEFPAMELHMIGALQRNKAKTAARIFDCIQSVDRNELIAELALHAPSRGKPLDILLELNAGEAAKSGYPDAGALAGAVEAALAVPALRIRGLMTMAPLIADDGAAARRAFRSLKQAADNLAARYPEADFSTLSMGMSGDFQIAIEEGSTLVRIGTAIFGEQP
jgi:pyridoxal phosphate enzyme (YggS family)